MALEHYTLYRSTTLTNTPTLVRDQPVLLLGHLITNLDTNKISLKCYDAASASDVTVGTTAPKENFNLVAGVDAQTGLKDGTRGVLYSNGLVVAVVQEGADSGTTAPGTSPIVNLYFD